MKFKKTLAVLATAVLVGLGISVPLSASAHHTSVYGTAVCNEETGLFDVTWTVENWQPGNPATVTESSRNVVPVGTVIDTSATFTENGIAANTTLNLLVKASWPNGQKSYNDGSVSTGGECEIPTPEKPEPLNGSDPVTITECVLPLNGTQTVTTTTTPWTQDYVLVDNQWVLGEKVYGTPVVTTETVPNADCEPPVVTPNPANPTALIEAVCGAATVTLTNPLIADANQLTASFVVFVNGKYSNAYAVMAGATEKIDLTFPEDSGNHKVEVFQAGTSEYKSIASATVTSDCEEPPVVVPPTEPPVTTPPVEEPPATTPPTEEPPAEIAEGEEFLANTGLSGGEVAWLATAGILVLALGTYLIVRGRKAKQ